MKPVRIMAVSGMLGYGFTEEAFRRGLDLGLDLIACDAGSADPGPYYLGSGSAFVSRLATKRDLGLMVMAGIELGVPVFVGSAGGSGTDAQVDVRVGLGEMPETMDQPLGREVRRHGHVQHAGFLAL